MTERREWTLYRVHGTDEWTTIGLTASMSRGSEEPRPPLESIRVLEASAIEKEREWAKAERAGRKQAETAERTLREMLRVAAEKRDTLQASLEEMTKQRDEYRERFMDSWDRDG